MTTLVYHEAAKVQSMQFLTAFQFGSYSNQSPTGFDVTDGLAGLATDHVTGTGIYWDQAGVPTQGTITAISGTFDGAANFTMTDLDMSVATLMHHWSLHDRGKLLHDFFGGADQETGSNDRDCLAGYGGDDVLNGGRGSDHLDGGAGQDILTGGAGNNRFIFEAVGDSSNDAPDTITDLKGGDVIDLHRIDPDLRLVAAFDGQAHELTLSYDAAHDRTSLQADLDGDGQADMTIWISGDHADFSHFKL